MNIDKDAVTFGISGMTSCQNARKSSRRSGSRTLAEDDEERAATAPFRQAEPGQMECISPVETDLSTSVQAGSRYSHSRPRDRYQSVPSPARSPAYLRSPSSSSLTPTALDVSGPSKRAGLSRRTSSPNMRSDEALKSTIQPYSPVARSRNTKYGPATPVKASRDSGLGLILDGSSETVLTSLSSSSPMVNLGDAVTSAVSNTVSKTRFRSGSVGSQAAEARTFHNATGATYQNGQVPRTRYSRSYTTSRVDLPSESVLRNETGVLPAWTETNETPSNPPSPKISKGKGRAYDPDLGMDVYTDDTNNLGLNDRYASRRTSQSFGSSDDSTSLLTGSSTLPTSLDGSTHLPELAPPTVTSAAGGILTGLWFAGTQVGKAMGLIPQDLPPGNDGYQNDGGYRQGKRRSSAWMPYPTVRRTSASDGGESEKGLLSHEDSDMDDSVAEAAHQRTEQSYFDLPKSDYTRTSQTLPTPALSSKSLSHPGTDHMRLGGARSDDSGDTSFGFASFQRMKNMITRGNETDTRDGMASPEAKAHREGRARSGTPSRRSGNVDAPQDTVKMDVALKKVVGELSWTLGTLGVVFVISLGVVAASLVSLPM